MWALGSMLFPNAQKDEVADQSPMVVEDASAQGEQASSDNSQAASTDTPTTQVDQPTFVVASGSPTAQPQPQNDQQPTQSQALNDQPQQLQAQQQILQPQQQILQPQPQLLQPQPQNAQQPTSQPQVSNEQAEPPRPQQKSETLSAKEVDRLTNLGEKFVAQGDLQTARRVLEHAANAHGARAALLLGATYDPDGLQKMGALGIRPDLEKAQMWYARAAEFGSKEASQRLAALARRH